MAYTSLWYHIVIRPKYSKNVITEEYETELYKYIWGFAKAKDCRLYRINGMADHIHMLVEINPSLSISDFVRMLKISTSNFLKKNNEKFPYFEGWGKSYCALSYNRKDKEMVLSYIKGQKEHHTKLGFRDELKALLVENGIPVDEAYYLRD